MEISQGRRSKDTHNLNTHYGHVETLEIYTQENKRKMKEVGNTGGNQDIFHDFKKQEFGHKLILDLIVSTHNQKYAYTPTDMEEQMAPDGPYFVIYGQ